MTTKTRNESIVLVIILLVTVFLIYHFFFANKPAATQSDALNLVQPAGPTNTLPTTTGTSAVVTSSPRSLPSVSGFLPNGAKLDTTVLNSPIYKSLVAPVYPVVSKDEVGESNPFVNQQAVAAAQAFAANPKK